MDILEIPTFVEGFTKHDEISQFDVSFKSISIPSTLTDLSFIFANSIITEVDLSNIDVANVTNLSYTFTNLKIN